MEARMKEEQSTSDESVVLYITMRDHAFGSVQRFTAHNFQPSQTVGDVKARIQATYGIAIGRQSLWLGNKLMNNDKNTLDSYKINRPAVPTIAHLEIAADDDGSPITLTLVSRFFRRHPPPSASAVTVTCKETDTVGELKKLVLAKWPGYARTKVELFCYGRQMADDEAPLLHYLVSHGAVVRANYSIADPVDQFPYPMTHRLLLDHPFLTDGNTHIFDLVDR